MKDSPRGGGGEDDAADAWLTKITAALLPIHRPHMPVAWGGAGTRTHAGPVTASSVQK